MIQCGYPEQQTIFNEQQYKKFIQEWNHKKNIYRSVYSFGGFKNNNPDFETSKIDKIYFDFDEDTHEIVQEFVKKLKEDNLKFYVNFSGRRGFHIYISCIHKNINRKYYLTFLHNYLIKKYNLQKYDPHIIGNVRQLARIENTFNIGGQLYCVPLKYEEIFLSFAEIKELAKSPRIEKQYWIDGKSLNIEVEYYDQSRTDNNNNFKDLLVLPEPCILRILNLVHPSQEERFLLCLWLSNQFREGKDINTFDLEPLCEKIISFMRELHWDDYSEALGTSKSTRYQVYNIINKRYNYIPSCAWRKQHGICFSEYCWDTKTINRNSFI